MIEQSIWAGGGGYKTEQSTQPGDGGYETGQSSPAGGDLDSGEVDRMRQKGIYML
jgi:hypothetical protein